MWLPVFLGAASIAEMNPLELTTGVIAFGGLKWEHRVLPIAKAGSVLDHGFFKRTCKRWLRPIFLALTKSHTFAI